MERMLDISVRGTPGSPTPFYVTSICPQITITIALLIGLIVGKFLNCFAIRQGRVGQVHKRQLCMTIFLAIVMYLLVRDEAHKTRPEKRRKARYEKSGSEKVVRSHRGCELTEVS